MVSEDIFIELIDFVRLSAELIRDLNEYSYESTGTYPVFVTCKNSISFVKRK